jgi:rhamnosyltransferase
MDISIIIPTYNAENYIEKQLKRLHSQNLNGINNYEIIVIDSSSTDKTPEIAKRFKKVKFIRIDKKDFDHGGTRTFAGKTARGDILIYLTQDAIPYNKNTIRNIVEPFLVEEKIGAAYGKQIPFENTNIFGKHLRYFNYGNKGYVKSYEDKYKFGVKATFLSNSFSAYRKNVLEKINWFPKKLLFGEDQIAGAKILKEGYKIAYVPEAIVIHSHSYSILEDFKRYFDIGAFHRMNKWLIEEFGKPEGEGLKYIKSEIKFILREHPSKLPESIIRNILKYLAYKIGYNYPKLPGVLIKNLSLHKSWWENNYSL